MATQQKDKFERFEEEQRKKLADMLPDKYEHNGETYTISPEVKKVAAEAKAADMAWRERIDHTSVFMSPIDKNAKGIEGLATAYRKWTAELGGPDFKGTSDKDLVEYVIKNQMRMYRADGAMEDFLEGGDVASLDKIKKAIIIDAKNKAVDKGREKVKQLRGENNQISGQRLIELGAVAAAYTNTSTYGAVAPNPIGEGLTDPAQLLSAGDLYAPQIEGPVAGARNLDRIINQYG